MEDNFDDAQFDGIRFDELLKKILDKKSDNIHIMEDRVDEQTMNEYMAYSKSIPHPHGDMDDDLTQKMADLLYSPDCPEEWKKKTLVCIAHFGTVLAYQIIEKYKQWDESLRSWSALALQECRMFLEGKLTNESCGFILGALGGTSNKLRYYVIIMPLNKDDRFSDLQKKVINDEFHYTSKQFDCDVEKIDSSADSYSEIMVLIPIDVDVQSYIEAVIKNCNSIGEFVFDGAYVTNRYIPTKEQIGPLIKKVREGDF